MVDMGRGMEVRRELAAVSPLHAEAKRIEALLAPPHPQLPNVRMRVGLVGRDELVLFEPMNGSDAWRLVGPCSKQLRKEVRPLLDRLAGKPGPRGALLLYYEFGLPS